MEGWSRPKLLRRRRSNTRSRRKNAKPRPSLDGIDCGIRVGIIVRADAAQAWEIAEQRFPEDRKGQIAHQLAMKVSDSFWHQQLSQTAKQTKTNRSPYWLRPFENYKNFCPYLVGSYDQVAEELVRYMALGYMTFLLDIPPSQEEFQHINSAFGRASQMLMSTKTIDVDACLSRRHV